MKLRESIKREDTQIYILATVMYTIGVLCEAFGYLSKVLAFVGTLFVIGSIIFSVALCCIWTKNNTRYLKGAVTHLCFLIISIALSLFYYFFKMYASLVCTAGFASVIAVTFIYDLFRIYYIYNDIIKK